MVRLSVVKGERSETAKNLEALNVARQLCVHTITLCKSEKNFPKRNRWLLTQPIVEQSVKVYTHMRKANAIKVVTWDDYKLRRAHQIKARTCLEALLGLIDITKEVLGDNGLNVEFWVKLTTQTEILLAAWRASRPLHQGAAESPALHPVHGRHDSGPRKPRDAGKRPAGNQNPRYRAGTGAEPQDADRAAAAGNPVPAMAFHSDPDGQGNPSHEPQKHRAGAPQDEATGGQGDERQHPTAIRLAELPKLAGQCS